VLAKAGGKYLLTLNIDTRLIAKKYHEGKVKRTLKRELKVRETDYKEGKEWNRKFTIQR
jgi:hypothetical protein